MPKASKKVKAKKKIKKSKKVKVKKKTELKPKKTKAKPILCICKDGYTIEERLGDVEYFSYVLFGIVRRFGLSEPPDLEELLRVSKIVLNHIMSMRFDDAIGYPVYPNSDFNSALIRIARKMIEIATKKLNEGQSYHDLYDKILEDLDKEEWRYEWDLKTR